VGTVEGMTEGCDVGNTEVTVDEVGIEVGWSEGFAVASAVGIVDGSVVGFPELVHVPAFIE